MKSAVRERNPSFFLEMVLSDSNPENYSPTFDKLNEDR